MLGTWKEGLAALRLHGVMLVKPSGEIEKFDVDVIEPGDDYKAKYALILVKSWQTERAAQNLLDVLKPDGVALTLQNGLGNLEILTDVLGDERAALGSTTTGATLLSSGRVRPGGEGVISLGEHKRIEPLIEMLREAGFAVEMADDVTCLVWSKLVINAAINPLTALLEVANGELLKRVSARILMGKLAEEVVQVAKALGIKLCFADPVKAAEKVAERTAGNHSSMYQDIMRGAPTEIDAICGAVVSAGREAGVQTPANEILQKLIKAKIEEGK
jgi:2-dehydropantoate 2-reductase